jgi:hypothetical protein
MLGYVCLVAAAVLFTFTLHELAHWAVGTWLGNEMQMTLNSAYPVARAYKEPWHSTVVSLAGPIVTLLQAFATFLLLRSGRQRWLYPFLLTPLIMRLLAGAMNVVNPNDEGRISQALGLGLYTIPFPVCTLLAFLVYRISRRHGFSAGFNAASAVLVVASSSVLILIEQVL